MVIGVFDSGIGGLTTLGEIMRVIDGDFIYCADKSCAPYGDKSTEIIFARCKKGVKYLLSEGAEIIVIACNTATNACIDALRCAFSCPIIGVEPAVRPAVKKYGSALVMLTPSAARQKKFLRLTAGMDLDIVTPKDLAPLIEQNIGDLENIEPYLREVLKDKQPSAVVLGCTHYVYVRALVDRILCGKAEIFDGNKGTAARVKDVVRTIRRGGEGKSVKFIAI